MTLKMGPVLSFRGWEVASQSWSLSALVVAEGPPGALTWTHGQSQGTADAEELWTVGARTAWRFRFGASLAPHQSALDYQILGQSNRVWLPAIGAAPRMTYASCAGFSDVKDMKRVADKNAMWRIMSDRHVDAHCHLLLLGGDQVYSDSMWTVIPSLRAWSELNFEAANDAVFTDEMALDLPFFFSRPIQAAGHSRKLQPCSRPSQLSPCGTTMTSWTAGAPTRIGARPATSSPGSGRSPDGLSRCSSSNSLPANPVPVRSLRQAGR